MEIFICFFNFVIKETNLIKNLNLGKYLLWKFIFKMILLKNIFLKLKFKKICSKRVNLAILKPHGLISKIDYIKGQFVIDQATC